MAIKLKVKFYVNLIEFIGKEEMQVDLADSEEHTIREVISKIDELEGKGFKKKALGTEARPIGSIRIVLNGKMVNGFHKYFVLYRMPSQKK